MTGSNDVVGNRAEVLLYQTEDGRTRVEARFDGESAWLSLGQMAELFQRDKSVISRHIKNVFDEGELIRESVVAEYATTAVDGKTYKVEHFNLDVIISVGYRVKSLRGTQFRIWATQRLREYIVKGFTLDDERLKRAGGGSYFDELLARIRDIRSSEKVFWKKVLEIYAASYPVFPAPPPRSTKFDTFHLTPYTLRPTPCALRPLPATSYPLLPPYAFGLTPYTLHLAPYAHRPPPATRYKLIADG